MAATVDESVGSTATAGVVRWLADWSAALAAGDVSAAAALFNEDGFWRDLVSFSWNIVTVEGREGVADLLGATLQRTRPRALAIEGQATEAGGIVEGWFTFETEIARGRAHLRLETARPGRC